MTLLRRRVLISGWLAAVVAPVARAQAPLKVAGLFAGSITDGGFMQAGYHGLQLAQQQLGCSIAIKDGVKPDKALLAAALRGLAQGRPDLVVAHGGQNNDAAKDVAGEFPDIAFVVTQGGVTGPNLASYEVLQEQSAFLAGALAALTTRTGVVGHMSGIRVPPGLKARAAYAAGVAQAAPGVKLLTNFSGNQDDNALSNRIALAMADAGADVIFTMLNAGRTGAVEACRARKIAQIGNVRDWIPDAPDVFIGSAIADSGIAVFAAVQDRAAGQLATGQVKSIGLERPEAVRLTTADRITPEVKAKLNDLAAQIVAGTVKLPTSWTGPEFG